MQDIRVGVDYVNVELVVIKSSVALVVMVVGYHLHRPNHLEQLMKKSMIYC